MPRFGSLQPPARSAGGAARTAANRHRGLEPWEEIKYARTKRPGNCVPPSPEIRRHHRVYAVRPLWKARM